MQIFQVVVSLFKRGSFFENEEAASLFVSDSGSTTRKAILPDFYFLP